MISPVPARVAVVGIRRRRTDGCARARQAVPRDPLRGRQPPRRSRGHPSRRRPRRFLGRRHRLHRAQRAHLPPPAPALRRARRADPGLRDVDVGARRHATGSMGRAGVRRRARPVRAVPLVAQRDASVVPADAGRDPALPPDGEATARRPDDRAATRRWARSSSAAGSRRCSAPTSWSRWSPACGRATRRWRSTTRRATCSPSSSTTACSASSARPTWRTVTGGSREYVERVAARLPDVRTGTKVTSVLETSDGVEITDGNGNVDTFDAVVLATHPGQTLAMLAEPTAGAARGALRDRVLPQHRPAAHRHQRAAPAAARPGVVELPAPAVDGGPHCHGQLRHAPVDAAARARGRQAVHRHPRRRGPRRPGAGHRHDGVRAPDLHARLGGRPAPAARVRHRPDRPRRRLARLGLPRGRRPVRRTRGREARRQLGGPVAAPGRGHDVRHHDPAHAA